MSTVVDMLERKVGSFILHFKINVSVVYFLLAILDTSRLCVVLIIYPHFYSPGNPTTGPIKAGPYVCTHVQSYMLIAYLKLGIFEF